MGKTWKDRNRRKGIDKIKKIGKKSKKEKYRRWEEE